MGIKSTLGRMFGQGASEQKSIRLTDPEIFPIFGITPSASGVTVTAASAMRVPAVRRAVSLIAEFVATLPFKTYVENKDAAKDHPSYALVHDWANDWTSAEKLRELLTADALLTGHGFAQVRRNADGKPVFFLRMAPGAVAIEYDDFGEPSYRVRLIGGGTMLLPFYDVLHVEALDGISPISHAREAIGLALAAEKHLAGFYKKGGRPSVVIKHPDTPSEQAKANLMSSWRELHTGGNSGGTAILDEGMELQVISQSHVDSQFLENRLEQVREIARAFNVPPALLYETSRATWSNFEQSHRDFLTGTLRPWIARWQAAYTRVLLAPEERGSFYIEATPDDLLSVEFAARATAYSQYRAMGAMTANEVRGGLNLPPLPEGNEITNPFTTTPGQTPPPEEPKDSEDE